MKGSSAKILKNIGIAVVCLCVLAYSVFHVSSLFSEEIGTIVVGPTTEKATTTLDGYIFRDATLVYPNKYGGAVDYLVENGEKVSAGTKLATVYSEGNSVEIKDTLALLDEQIALLESTTEQKTSVSGITELRRKASDAYYSIMKQLSGGTDIAFAAQQKKLLVALNSIALLTDEGFEIEGTLAALKASRAELLGAGGDSEAVSTQKSGYFYTGVDGYEQAFSGSAACELDRAGFLHLFAYPEMSSDVGNSIGKMSYNSNWYFAAELDAKEAEKFDEGERYTVEFTSGGYFEIRMTVDRVLKGTGDESAVIVLSSNILPENFNFRRQTARIVTDSVSGIYVPRSAVHRENFKEVVYILKGSVVQRRYIEVIYEGSDYYIVKENVDNGDGKTYLSSNELLIVKGSNLFDGRILG